jgi:DNA-binding transcriptional LysR family regulator
MDLRHLEHFVAVAEARNFTRAAERLHIVQSAVSASIRTLERSLQAELFNRTTQRVELTDAGAMLLPQARRILAEVQTARELVADVRGGLRGTLTIGTMQALSGGQLDIPRLLAAFRESHPLLDVHLRYAANGSAELADQLRDGQLDIAVLSLPERGHAGISMTLLSREAMVLVCAPEHRLAKRKSVRISELGGESFIDHPGGWGTRAAIDRIFATAGVRRQVAFEVGDTPSVVNLVAHGLGVAFLPPSIVPPGDNVRLVPVRGKAPQWEISLAVPSNRPLTAAARAFADAAASG